MLPAAEKLWSPEPARCCSFFSLIFLILAWVFPLDAFKTLYDFDTFVIFAFKTNTFLTFLLWSGAGVSWEAILFLSWAALACLGVSWGRLGASWGRLGVVLGGVFGRLGLP